MTESRLGAKWIQNEPGIYVTLESEGNFKDGWIISKKLTLKDPLAK